MRIFGMALAGGGKNRSLLGFALLVLSLSLIACGGGGGSSAPTATAPSTAPTVTATASIGAVSLSWTAVTDATSYNIYQGTSTGVSTTTASSTSTTTSKSITGLTNGTTYYFVVKAVNSVGEGPASAEVSSAPSSITAVAAGGYSAALKSDGTVWMWNLGSSIPEKISSLSGMTAVAAESSYTIALKSDGAVYLIRDVSLQYPITGTSSVTKIAGGGAHLLLLDSSGNVWTQGNNDWGQLGNGVTTWNQSVATSYAAVQVPNLSSVSAITAGAHFSVALKTDGTVREWGKVYDYTNSPTGCQAGYSGASGVNNVGCANPIQVSGLSDITAISASSSGSHVLALKSDGTVWTWGAADRNTSDQWVGNTHGELGNGTTTPSVTPVQVSGLSGITKIFAGAGVSFAQTSDGTTYAWGDNSSGQYGNGTTTSSLTPVVVSALSGMTLSAGSAHVLGVKADGTAWAWGNGTNGELGNGGSTSSLVPVSPTF